MTWGGTDHDVVRLNVTVDYSTAMYEAHSQRNVAKEGQKEAPRVKPNVLSLDCIKKTPFWTILHHQVWYIPFFLLLYTVSLK